eukprot:scaffold305_cov247-Pinguiococcus_pyrenoidosus.AAC.3
MRTGSRPHCSPQGTRRRWASGNALLSCLRGRFDSPAERRAPLGWHAGVDVVDKGPAHIAPVDNLDAAVDVIAGVALVVSRSQVPYLVEASGEVAYTLIPQSSGCQLGAAL